MRTHNGIFMFAVLVLAGSLVYIGSQLANNNTGFAANTISVSGEWTALIAPDTMIISLSISELAPTNTEAQTLVNNKMRELRTFLASNNIADKDISTDALSVHQEYDRTQDGRQPLWYRASQFLTITLQDDNFVGRGEQLLNDIITIDGIIINNTQFTLKNRDAAMQKARAQAFVNAQERATQLANAAGLRLRKPVSIIDDYVHYYDGPIYPMMGRTEMAMDSVDAGIDLPMGETEVRVQIQVIFETR